MELKKVITLGFNRKEWNTLLDAARLLEDLGKELQKLGPNEDVTLRCSENGVECVFIASQLYEFSTTLDLIAEGGTITTS
jgi:hypothetical protein